MKRNEFAKLAQAVETLGGARVGCEAKTCEAGVSAYEAEMAISRFRAKTEDGQVPGCAD